jgi:PadR family transcriptional regulator
MCVGGLCEGLTLYRLPTMGDDEPRLTEPTLRVIATLLTSPRDELSGAEIGRNARISSGTLYPILSRLERASWLVSRWETEEPQLLGRPRRRFYRVTALGVRRAEAALRELEPAIRRLAWN